jgi:cell division protein FtsB
MSRSSSARRSRPSRSRILLRWLALGVLAFVAFLYYQPMRSYFETRDALDDRATEVRALREEKRSLERRLAAGETPEALAREARRLGLVKPGEQLFIIKGIDAWRRAQARRAKH